MATPMLIAQLLNLLYNIVDRIYIGKIPGEGTLALASIGLCFPFVTLITAFANLFGLGGAPLCAMARGKGNREGAQGIMVNAGFMLLLSGAVLTVLGIVFHRPLLYLFGASEVTYPYASCLLYTSHIALRGWEQVGVVVGDIDAFVSHPVSNRYRRIAHFNQK